MHFGRRYAAQIPDHDRALVPGAGETPRWESQVYGAFTGLQARGLADKVGSGRWCITEAGRALLAAHSEGDLAGGTSVQAAPRMAATYGDAQLLAAAKIEVRRIQDYLNGRSEERPSSALLCDWIHFCYTLGLDYEASALWPLVNPDEVNPWYAGRARKLAIICRCRP